MKRKSVSRQGGSNPRSTAYEAVALPLGHTGCCSKSRPPIYLEQVTGRSEGYIRANGVSVTLKLPKL
jgi:hypothetical protein